MKLSILVLSEFAVVLCKKEDSVLFALLFSVFLLFLFCGMESGDEGVSFTGLRDATNFCPVTTCHICFSILSVPLYCGE